MARSEGFLWKGLLPKGMPLALEGVVVHAANLHDGVMAQSERIPWEKVVKPVLGYLHHFKKVYADHAYKVDLGNATGIPFPRGSSQGVLWTFGVGLARYIVFRY